MFKSIIFLLTAFYLFGFSAPAQNNVSYGMPYRVFDAEEIPSEENKFYLKQGNEIISLKRNANFIYLEKLDAQKLTMSKLHIYNDFPKKFEIEQVAGFGGKYYLFYSARNTQSGHEMLYYREINIQEGLFVKAGKPLLDTGEKLPFTPGIKKFTFDNSSDSTMLLISFMLNPEKDAHGHECAVMDLAIFNNSLMTLDHQKFRMLYSDKKIEDMHKCIDAEGNIYILYQVMNQKTLKFGNTIRDWEGTYHMELNMIKFKSSTVQMSPFVFQDTALTKSWWMQNTRIFDGHGGYVFCAGYYSLNKDSIRADGMFFFKIGRDGRQYDMTSHAIEPEIRDQYSKQEWLPGNQILQEGDKTELADLQLTDLIELEDGSILLIGEQQYFTENFNKTSRMSKFFTLNHYNDLLVIKIDPVGKLSWMNKLPKSQTTLFKKGMMSYQYRQEGKYHYFLYVDNEKNRVLNTSKCPVTCTDRTAVLLTVYRIDDVTGAVKKLPLLDTKNALDMNDFAVFPARVLQLSSHELITEVTKKKNNEILIKIEIPQ